MTQKIETIFEQDYGDGKKGILGVDADGRLFWKERLLITKQKVSFNWWVNFAVFIGGLSTAVIAVFTILLYYKCS